MGETVRPPAERAKICEAALELIARFGPQYANRARVELTVRAVLAANSGSDLILAADDTDQIIGMVTITFVPNFEGPRAILGNLVVAEAYEDNGVASALLAKVDEMGRERDMQLVSAAIDRDAPERVLRLYRRAGYAQDASDGYHKYL